MDILKCCSRPCKWLNGTHSRTGWEYIRRIRRSPVFGSIVFFPILAAVLTLGGKTQTFLFFIFPVEVSLRVHILYWAMFCLFLGTLVYTLYCPDMFVRYETRFDYARSEIKILRHPAFARRTVKFVEERLMDLGPEIRKYNSKIVDNIEDISTKMNKALDDQSVKKIDISLIAELVSAHWSFMNRAYRPARVLINLLYHAGILLVGCVVFISIIEVLCSYFYSQCCDVPFLRSILSCGR